MLLLILEVSYIDERRVLPVAERDEKVTNERKVRLSAHNLREVKKIILLLRLLRRK